MCDTHTHTHGGPAVNAEVGSLPADQISLLCRLLRNMFAAARVKQCVGVERVEQWEWAREEDADLSGRKREEPSKDGLFVDAVKPDGDSEETTAATV